MLCFNQYQRAGASSVMTNIVRIVFTLLVAALSFTSYAQDSVILIRHGEKPATGDNLNCKGLNRAAALPGVLRSKFRLPTHIYVPTVKTGSDTRDARMFQTITPFAVQYNLSINTKHDVTDTKGVANGVIGKKGTVLIVWEHDNIDNIARALGVKDAPKWKGDDFDSIWIILNAGTKSAKLVIGSEGLNGVSGSCQ
jgi:hypothetical protein